MKSSPTAHKITLRVILTTVIAIILAIVATTMFLAYGPFTYFRDLWITSAMTTINHKYLATWFFSEEQIDEAMLKNRVIEPNGETDTDLVTIESSVKGTKLIHINKNGFRAYLLKIYDPSTVRLAVTSKLNVKGQLLPEIAEENGAVAAINAGGFLDANGRGNGGTPTGIVVQNGEIRFDTGSDSYSIIGFNEDNVLILGKFTPEEIREKKIRDAVSFEPFLILNGEPSIVKGNGGWGIAPRTVIGQTEKGAVLFLVVDGRQAGSVGATLKDVMDIMVEYGAVNAANLDGGSSTALYLNGEVVSKPTAAMPNGLRHIPTAFVMVEQKPKFPIVTE